MNLPKDNFYIVIFALNWDTEVNFYEMSIA